MFSRALKQEGTDNNTGSCQQMHSGHLRWPAMYGSPSSDHMMQIHYDDWSGNTWLPAMACPSFQHSCTSSSARILEGGCTVQQRYVPIQLLPLRIADGSQSCGAGSPLGGTSLESQPSMAQYGSLFSARLQSTYKSALSSSSGASNCCRWSGIIQQTGRANSPPLGS